MAELYDSDEEELTIENDAVLTKYKTAGEISNMVSSHDLPPDSFLVFCLIKYLKFLADV